MDAAACNERVVVIAMDGSEHADYAFECTKDEYVGGDEPRYLNHIHKTGDKVILLHVPEYHTLAQSPIFTVDPTAVCDMLAEEEVQIRQYLESLRKRFTDNKINGMVKSVEGKPGETIVRVAKEENATLIVTGARGMRAIRRTLMGSNSDYVVHHSLIPVMVCKHDDS